MPWILEDFRSPRRTPRRFEDFFNRKGLVSGRDERKKDSTSNPRPEVPLGEMKSRPLP